MRIQAGIQRASQVAIRENTYHLAFEIEDRRHSQALGRHFHDRLADRCIVLNTGNVIAGMHDVPDVEQQSSAQLSGRVRQGEIFTGKAAGFQQGNRQRVPHDQGRGGAGGRRQAQRAGFFFNADVEMDIGVPGQGRIRVAGHCHDFDADAFQTRAG